MRRFIVIGLGALLLLSACEAGSGDAPVTSSAQSLLSYKFSQPARARNLPVFVQSALRIGAERLSDLQADQLGDNAGNGLSDTDPDDGGWDWTLPAASASHSDSASATNVYGATALGALAAIRAGVELPRVRTTLLDAALGIQRIPEVHSAPDVVFLPLLAAIAEDPGWSELARARYDAQRAEVGSALALGERARDERHAGDLDGLIPYDLAWRALGAASLDAAFAGAGYDLDADTFAQLATRELAGPTPLFDPTDSQESFYTHGLAWSLFVLARTGSEPELLAAVRDRLLDAQHDNGAWGWNATYTDDNIQATAHATQALTLAAGSGRREWSAAWRGAGWLLHNQAANGGWANADDIENPQVDAEALLAIYLVAAGWRSDELGLRDAASGNEYTSLRAGVAPMSAPSVR